MGEELDKSSGFFLSIVFNLCSQCFAKEALEVSADYKIGGQAIFSTKYTDDIVLRAEVKRFYRAQLIDLLKLEDGLGWKRTWKTLR